MPLADHFQDGFCNEETDDKFQSPIVEGAQISASTIRDKAAKLAENPYSDEVQVIGREEPLAVGKKIAAAIRAIKLIDQIIGKEKRKQKSRYADAKP